jgi:hypothetical protein
MRKPHQQGDIHMSDEALMMVSILVLYGLFWLIAGMAAGRMIWGY